MARRCELCQKGPLFGHRVSHSGRRTKRVQKPNLHHVRVMTEEGIKWMRLCSKCLKKTKVVEE